MDDLLSLSRSSEKQSAIKVQKPSLPPRQKSGSLNISELAGDESEEKNGIFQRQKSQSLIRYVAHIDKATTRDLRSVVSGGMFVCLLTFKRWFKILPSYLSDYRDHIKSTEDYHGNKMANDFNGGLSW